ncbi:MAG: hypothetical protein HN348_17795 [Proteobacteria bacterium]|jgi:hypothetical protein|nr:hypothetical protein [Pseudomonadota bacterium]
MHWLKLGILSVTTMLMFTGCCWCCGGGMTEEERAAWEEERKKREAEEEAEKKAAIKRASDRIASLDTLHQVIDKEPSNDNTKCPHELFEAEIPDLLFREDMQTVDYYALEWAEKDFEPWAFFESGDIESYRRWKKYPNDSASTRNMWAESIGAKKNRFIVVLLPRDRGLASGFKEGGILSDGSFESAFFEGSLVVVDIDDRKILCRAPVKAENSETVDYDDDGLLKTTFEEAVQEDFEQNLEDAVNEALEEITEKLSVNTIGIF